MAPCGPLYSLRSVCHRQDLDTSRPFKIGEPVRYPPYSACKIESEVLHLVLRQGRIDGARGYSARLFQQGVSYSDGKSAFQDLHAHR